MNTVQHAWYMLPSVGNIIRKKIIFSRDRAFYIPSPPNFDQWHVDFIWFLKLLSGYRKRFDTSTKSQYSIKLSERDRFVPFFYRCCIATHRIWVYRLRFLRLYCTKVVCFDRFGSTSIPTCMQELPHFCAKFEADWCNRQENVTQTDCQMDKFKSV